MFTHEENGKAETRNEEKRQEDGENLVNCRAFRNDLTVEQAQRERAISQGHKAIIIGKVLHSVDNKVLITECLTSNFVITKRDDSRVVGIAEAHLIAYDVAIADKDHLGRRGLRLFLPAAS